MSGVVPSEIVLISELAACPAEKRVRFIGMITQVRGGAGEVVVSDNKGFDVVVDYFHIDGSAHHLIRYGNWISVIGYTKGPTSTTTTTTATTMPHVQAVLLWSAGAVNIDTYERGLAVKRADTSESGGNR